MNWTREQLAAHYRNQGREVPAEFQGHEEIRKRAEKFGRVKKFRDGILFDSTLEADAWVILRMWERAGIIRDLERQPRFELQAKMPRAEAIRKTSKSGYSWWDKTHRSVVYKADFQHVETATGITVITDAKGLKTKEFVIKEKLFRAKFPDLRLEIWDKTRVRELCAWSVKSTLWGLALHRINR